MLPSDGSSSLWLSWPLLDSGTPSGGQPRNNRRQKASKSVRRLLMLISTLSYDGWMATVVGPMMENVVLQRVLCVYIKK